jgi:hypothetical protein|nr:MAG TPA: hypothetical protein [Caudoviricetes sp.]
MTKLFILAVTSICKGIVWVLCRVILAALGALVPWAINFAKRKEQEAFEEKASAVDKTSEALGKGKKEKTVKTVTTYDIVVR